MGSPPGPYLLASRRARQSHSKAGLQNGTRAMSVTFRRCNPGCGHQSGVFRCAGSRTDRSWIAKGLLDSWRVGRNRILNRRLDARPCPGTHVRPGGRLPSPGPPRVPTRLRATTRVGARGEAALRERSPTASHGLARARICKAAEPRRGKPPVRPPCEDAPSDLRAISRVASRLQSPSRDRPWRRGHAGRVVAPTSSGVDARAAGSLSTSAGTRWMRSTLSSAGTPTRRGKP